MKDDGGGLLSDRDIKYQVIFHIKKNATTTTTTTSTPFTSLLKLMFFFSSVVVHIMTVLLCSPEIGKKD